MAHQLAHQILYRARCRRREIERDRNSIVFTVFIPFTVFTLFIVFTHIAVFTTATVF